VVSDPRNEALASALEAAVPNIRAYIDDIGDRRPIRVVDLRSDRTLIISDDDAGPPIGEDGAAPAAVVIGQYWGPWRPDDDSDDDSDDNDRDEEGDPCGPMLTPAVGVPPDAMPPGFTWGYRLYHWLVPIVRAWAVARDD
jgi:hypothetical protein